MDYFRGYAREDAMAAEQESLAEYENVFPNRKHCGVRAASKSNQLLCELRCFDKSEVSSTAFYLLLDNQIDATSFFKMFDQAFYVYAGRFDF